MTGRRPRAPTLAGLVGWALAMVGFAVGCRPLSDNSVFTHLATGRLILDEGIPTQDPYTFTAQGEPWVVQSWLVSAVYAVLERLAGLEGVRLAAGVLTATLVALAWRLTRSSSIMVRAGLMLLVLGAGTPYWAPRPLLVGLVLLALVLVVVAEDRDPRLLVPVMWVWVNAHGSFPLGVLAVGALCLGRVLDARAAAVDGAADPADPANPAVAADAGPRPWRPLVWVVVGVLAGAIGPLGLRLLVFPVQVLGRMEVLSRVVEWHSPSFDQLFTRIFLVQLVVAVLVLVRRPAYRAAVPLVVFAAIALVGQRSIPIASLVMLPGMAGGLAGLGQVSGRERRGVFAVAGAVLAVVALLVAGQTLRVPSVALASYPVDGLAWLEANGALEPDRRVATTDTTGNLIELWRGRRSRVFYDDRYDMFPPDVSRDYLALNDASARWDQVLVDRRIEYVLWPRSSPLVGLLASSPHWRTRFQDAESVVFCLRERGPEDDEC